MPAWLKGKDSEDAWEKAKSIAMDEYSEEKDKDPDKFYAIVATIYKKICGSNKYACGVGESESVASGSMRLLIEKLGRIVNIGNPDARAMAVYDLSRKIRNFSGEMAMALADKSDPYGELAHNHPGVKRSGRKMVDSMKSFVSSVEKTETYIDVKGEKPRKTRGLLR